VTTNIGTARLAANPIKEARYFSRQSTRNGIVAAALEPGTSVSFTTVTGE
jgi:hypothetical protein